MLNITTPRISIVTKSSFFANTLNSQDIYITNIISPTLKMAAEEGNNWQKTTHMGCVTARHKIIDKY